MTPQQQQVKFPASQHVYKCKHMFTIVITKHDKISCFCLSFCQLIVYLHRQQRCVQMFNRFIYKVMSNEEIDPTKVKKWIDLAIAILTAIGGFLFGMGSASACNLMSNL